MTDDRSLERAARSWLEAGPTRAPEHAVEAALDRIERTSQERDWRFLPLGGVRIHRIGRPIGAIAMVTIVLLAGLVLFQRGPEPGPAVSPSPSPSSSETPPASPSVTTSSGGGEAGLLIVLFTSPLHGYSVQYPADWTVTPATAHWDNGVINQWGSPALDELQGATARFVGASQPLAAGQSADQWLAAYAAGACITPRSSWLTVPIGTATGYIDADGCEAPDPPLGKGGPLFDAVVIVGGRAYSFTMDGKLSHSDFVSFLAAVSLDPASAK